MRHFRENVLKKYIGLLEILFGKWYNTLKEKKENKNMSNRQRTEGQARRDFIKICCFVTLLLAAVLIFVQNFLPLIGVDVSGTLFDVLRLIKDIALLLGIVFGAYSFARAHGKTWVIIFWIAVALYVASAILGLF